MSRSRARRNRIASTLVTAATAVFLLAGSCADSSGSSPTVGPVRAHDFFGLVQSFELDAWTTSSGVITTGGPESSMLAGPAVFVLSDGTRVEVPPRTPGANYCDRLAFTAEDPALPDDCVVIGEFVEGTQQAAWFGVTGGTVRDGRTDLHLVTLRDTEAVVTTVDEEFVFQLANSITYHSRCHEASPGSVPATEVTLSSAPTHLVVIELQTHQVVEIVCNYEL